MGTRQLKLIFLLQEKGNLFKGFKTHYPEASADNVIGP